MNYRSFLRAMVVMMVIGQATVTACLLEPPLNDASNGTLSGNVGQTLTFTGTGKFHCPDGGQIAAYRWVLPAQAYCIEGDDTPTLTCKFSPGGASYEVELQVMCSHGLWNTEDVNYTSTNRFIYRVTISSVTGAWYVSPDGNDGNDGQSWQNAFRTIQTAIDSAISEEDHAQGESSHEIYVKSGSAESPVVYYEHLDLKGKNLTITSETPDDWEAVENTIIHADQRGTGVVYQGPETGTFKGFTITGAAPKGDDLALHLTFDNESNPGEDSSGKERDATPYGSPAWSSAGYDGGMLTFDGVDDYLNVEGYAGIVGRGARTCSAWVKVSGTKATPYAVLSWGKDIASDTKFVFGLTSTGKVCVYTCYFGIFGNSVLNDGDWHHIAAVIESSGDPTLGDVKLYADGVLQTPSFAGGTGASSAPINTEIGDFLIGAYDYEGTTGLGAWHQGSLDDVKLYSRALTEGQIQAQVFSGPVAHWALDEESGTQANDTSGNNQIGTLYGDVSRVDGRVSRAIRLAGNDDYVQIQDSPNFEFTGALSLVAWVRPAADMSGSGRVIYQYDDASQDGILLSYENANWRFGICIDDYTTAKFAYSVSAPQKEVWTHLVGRRDSNGLLELFVNGVKQPFTETFAGTVDSSGTLYLGVDYALNCDFKGDLDDIRVYNRALTDAEIQDMAGEAGLIARWALDGDANDAVGVNHGTNNGVALTADGILGTAAQFDGSDYIEVEGYSGIIGSDSRTISAWIKKPSSTANEMVCAWGKADYSDQGKGFGLFVAGNNLALGLRGPYMRGTTNIGDDKWHHVAAVLHNDGSPILREVKLYIDGKLEPIDLNVWQYFTAPINTYAGNLTLGAVKFTPTNSIENQFTGLIDDVRLYNHALSSGQIQHLYQSRFAEGGGMKGRGAPAAVEKCIFNDNVSEANGGGLQGMDGTVQNCFIINNESQADGGGLADCNGDITNCVIAENIAQNGGGAENCNGNLFHCTVANNVAASGGGGLRNCSGVIANSIIWNNIPDVLTNCTLPFFSCFSGGTGNNTKSNPFFVDINNISGSDDRLGTLDDGLRLKGIASSCYDSGDNNISIDTPADISGNIRQYQEAVDMGAYELKYVKVPDVKMKQRTEAENELNTEIGLLAVVTEVPNDIYASGLVISQFPESENNYAELFSSVDIIVAKEHDTSAPIPNPMTWQIQPVLTGTNTSVTMTASLAEDDNGVEYFFEETTANSGGNSSGWQDSNVYSDYGLKTGYSYTYRVKARDKSYLQNETGWSPVSSVFVSGVDTTSPLSWKLGFDSMPTAVGWNCIAMKAVILEDPDNSGIEYYFEEISGNPGGSDSGWQDSPAYRDYDVVEGCTYTYRVKARNKSTQGNEVLWSYTFDIQFEPTTQLADQLSPSPNPTTWELTPIAGAGTRNLAMIAQIANDNVTPTADIEYYFKCFMGNGHDSGWMRNRSYIDWDLFPEMEYAYKVKARDQAGNETEWSQLESAMISDKYGYDIQFDVHDMGDGRIRIGYISLDSSIQIRSVALKITLENAMIQGVSDIIASDSRYNCYMDYAAASTGYVFGTGHPLAVPDQPGTPDFMAGGMTEFGINMSRFDEFGIAMPGPQVCENLVTIQLHKITEGPATITISPDPLRKSSFTESTIVTNLPISDFVVIE